jgi:hypothetical protein
MEVEVFHHVLGKSSMSDGDCGYVLAAGPVMMWTIGWRPWTDLYMGMRSDDAADGMMINSSGRRGEWTAVRMQPLDSIGPAPE